MQIGKEGERILYGGYPYKEIQRDVYSEPYLFNFVRLGPVTSVELSKDQQAEAFNRTRM